jgi:hypothetical protein
VGESARRTRHRALRVIDTDGPLPYSVVVFRDPDNIQLELFHMAT